MPLSLSALEDGLEVLFTDLPGGPDAAAQGWASSMESYSSGVVPASTTVSAASATLETALASAFAASKTNPASILPAMETAFSAFAATVGTGMAPTFVATPPPAPVGFATLSAPVPDVGTAVSLWASLINVWMKTGTATPVAPGPTVNWS